MAVVPQDHLYTWTFSRKSLLIRMYLWIYEADEKSVNFCKLFWGVVCSPVTIPVRIVVGVLRLLRKGLHLIAVGIDKWLLPPLEHVGAWRDEAKERREEQERRRKQKLEERRQQERDAELICMILGLEPPPPRWTSDPRKVAKFEADKAREAAREAERERMEKEKEQKAKEKKEREEAAAAKRKAEAEEAARIRAPKTPVTEKIAAAVGARVDAMVAWFQAHPQIGATVDAATTKIGRFFVRCIFYPLMIAIPASAFGFVAYLVYSHIHGPASAGSGILHGIATLIGVVWFPTLLSLGAFLVFGGLLTGVMWVSWKAGAMEPSGNYEVGPVEDLRLWHSKRPAGRAVIPAPMVTVYSQGWKNLGVQVDRGMEKFEHGAIRTYKVLTPVGHGITHVFDAGVWSVCMLGRGVRGVYRMTAATLLAVVSVVLAIIQLMARSTKSTGKFFVIGHHAVKYRTCPRIQITQDSQ